MPASNKIKKPWAIKGWMGLLYAQDFLTLAPKPAKATPHSLRPTMGCFVRMRTADDHYPGRHGPCIWMERARSAPASFAGPPASHLFSRPPQRRRCAPICASNVVPPSSLLPATFVYTSFAIRIFGVYLRRPTVGGAPSFYFLAAVCKSCANKGVAKETFPLVRASDNLQSSPVCS